MLTSDEFKAITKMQLCTSSKYGYMGHTVYRGSKHFLGIHFQYNIGTDWISSYAFTDHNSTSEHRLMLCDPALISNIARYIKNIWHAKTEQEVYDY